MALPLVKDVEQKVVQTVAASHRCQLGGIGQGGSISDDGGALPARGVARDPHETVLVIGIVQLGTDGAVVGDRQGSFRLGITGIFDPRD